MHVLHAVMGGIIQRADVTAFSLFPLFLLSLSASLAVSAGHPLLAMPRD